RPKRPASIRGGSRASTKTRSENCELKGQDRQRLRDASVSVGPASIAYSSGQILTLESVRTPRMPKTTLPLTTPRPDLDLDLNRAAGVANRLPDLLPHRASHRVR